ncbi:MAG: GGDEF domain-containing response regulator [Planctomycetota bacterium]|jgi:diguanylate cyclase (GGDEF)-like protein
MAETGRPVVLAVDDDPDVSALLARALAESFSVSVCSDPASVEGMIREQEPQVILLDQDMPGRSGIEVCQAVRTHDEWNSIPILFVTAFAEGSKLLEFYRVGANDALQKPFRVAELRAKISVWASLHQRGLVLANQNRELLRISRRDPLTGLYNRRYGLELLEQEFARFRRYGSVSTLLFIDIDHFKQANDVHGHAYGDEILISIGRRLSSLLRETDQCIRYGGDEFLVVLPETSLLTAGEVKERILQAVEVDPLCDDPSLQLGFSIGVAAVDAKIDTVQAWLEAADREMYARKGEVHSAGRSTKQSGRYSSIRRVINGVSIDEKAEEGETSGAALARHDELVTAAQVIRENTRILLERDGMDDVDRTRLETVYESSRRLSSLLERLLPS